MFKLLVMIALLCGVIWTIRHVNETSMAHTFEALGLQAGGAGSPGLQAASRPLSPGEERFNLCRTRINAIEFEGGRKIYESTAGIKTTWLASEPGRIPREIGTLDIEKWLTQHCQIVIRAAAPPSLNDVSSFDIFFVDGTEMKIKRVGSATFELENQWVLSDDFAAALTEIQTLAQFQPATGR